MAHALSQCSLVHGGPRHAHSQCTPARSSSLRQAEQTAMTASAAQAGRQSLWLVAGIALVPRSGHAAPRSAHVAAASRTDASTDSAEALRVTLPTKEAQQSIKFALARAGRETAVIVNRLSGGTSAAEAGVRPGQRLLSISDPMSSGMWDLNDRPSVRFVRDALAMRNSDSIDLVLSRDSLYEPGASAAQPQMSIDEIDTGNTGVSGRDDAQQSTGGTTSVGQQLQQQFQERENEVAAQRTAFERRQKRRKEFFEKESSRDDGSFIAITAAVILLPAIGILAVAFFSGYLDRLSDSYTITR